MDKLAALLEIIADQREQIAELRRFRQRAEPPLTRDGGGGVHHVGVAVGPTGLLNRKDAAAFVGRAPKTLAEWHRTGKGPKRKMIGGRCFYREADLRAFMGGADCS